MEKEPITIQGLEKLKEEKKKVLGYGATAKAVTILNYCNINNDLINIFTDINLSTFYLSIVPW